MTPRSPGSDILWKIVVSIIWILLCGFTPYAEGQRLYIGEDRTVDWVDVGCLYRQDTDGTCCVECWCDNSPIVSVEGPKQLTVATGWVITKQHSTWQLIYDYDYVTLEQPAIYPEVRVHLLEPAEANQQCPKP